jgi:hypothetical protein
MSRMKSAPSAVTATQRGNIPEILDDRKSPIDGKQRATMSMAVDITTAVDDTVETDTFRENGSDSTLLKIIQKDGKRARCHTLKRRIPCLQTLSDRFRRIPPKYRYGCFICWMVYKVITAVLFVVLFHKHVSHRHASDNDHKDPVQYDRKTAKDFSDKRTLMMHRLQSKDSSHNYDNDERPIKILYIVTSLAEYNNGRRSTIAGQDRLGEVVLPILIDSVESMVYDPQLNYQVDVYMILAYPLRSDREAMIRERLPPIVGLQIWDDACPLGYDSSKSAAAITNNTRALARQHRYVIKDKLPYYDVFVAFEDDMRITGAHVQHFLAVSKELDALRRSVAMSTPTSNSTLTDSFFGTMTPRQLDRLIPGFVRVEVLLNEAENGAQLELDPIPLDYSVETIEATQSITNVDVHFDPRPCCHVLMKPNVGTPIHPESKDVILWETSIQALAVRQLPVTKRNSGNTDTVNNPPFLDWVALLPGPGKRLLPDDMIPSYWSGKISNNGVWQVRPSPGQPDLIAQQGGWMATTEQIVRLDYQTDDHNYPQLCQGTFLPPFNEPIYRQDGQASMNVEL